MKKAWVLSYPLSAQADLSLRWAHMPFCWFCHEAVHYTNYQTRFYGLFVDSNYNCNSAHAASLSLSLRDPLGVTIRLGVICERERRENMSSVILLQGLG